VSLVTGKVLGLHLGGRYLEENYAASMWHVLNDPIIRERAPEIFKRVDEERKAARPTPRRAVAATVRDGTSSHVARSPNDRSLHQSTGELNDENVR
jgi:hypothetical protein